MPDCGTHDYQMIEYANLFDLRDMQLLRAEIDAVDRPNNTADITLLDICPNYPSATLTDIPFWYHCQYSTGTIEDLANGHNAFSINDMIYVIHIPANGDVLERMYIVGHVDIRGTRPCPTEFLFLTLDFTIRTVDYSYTTIFDASTGAKLDLASFVNKDSGSPAKPASLPADSSSMAAWQIYNFGTPPADGYTVTGGVTALPSYLPADFDYYSTPECYRTETLTNYSGDAAGTECALFNVGNGLHSDVVDVSCYYSGTGTEYWEEYDLSVSGSGIAKVSTTGSLCGPVSTSSGYSKILDMHGVTGTLIVTASGSSASIPLTFSYQYSNTASGTCDIEGTIIDSASFTASESFTKEVYFDFSSINVPNIGVETTWTASMAGSIPTTPVYDAAAHPLTFTTLTTSHNLESPKFSDLRYGGYDGMTDRYFQPWANMTTQTSTFIKGRYYMYVLFGACSIEMQSVTSAGQECEAYAYNVNGVYPGSFISQQKVGSQKYTIKFIPGTHVTLKNSILPTPPIYAISALNCILGRNSTISSGLNTVITELMEYIVSERIDYSDLTVANADVLEIMASASYGPAGTVLLKRS